MALLNRLIFITCLLATSHLALCQVIGPEHYANPSRATITRFVNVLKAGELISLDSVLKPASQQAFSKTQKDFVVYSKYDSLYYWFRLVIKNNDSVPTDLRLLMAPVGMLDGRLYQKRDDSWQMIAESGYKLRFIDRAYQYAHYVFPLTVPAATTDTFYMSMDASHSFKSYGFALMQPRALKIFENQVYFKLGIIVGLLLLFCIFNLYLFFIIREKIYAWYAAYVGMLVVIVIKYDQLDQQFFNWDSEEAYHMTSIMGIAAFAIALLMHVVQQFLSVIKKESFLYWLSRFMTWNALLSGVAQLVTFYIKPDYHIQNIVFYWCNYSTILTICVIIADCIYSIFKGYKSAYFIAGGLVVFLFGAMQKLMLKGDSTSLFPPSVFHYGMVLETLIISFGLIYQYRLDRNEKNLYHKEKEDLQNNFDKLLLKSKIEIQEQTFGNISQEINQHIGKDIEDIIRRLNGLSSEPAANRDESLTLLKKQISKVNADFRNLSKSLDTDFVMQTGLLHSISYELEQLDKAGLCETSINIEGDPYGIDPQKELIMFRLFQEIVNSITRQEKACRIRAQITYRDGLLELKFSRVDTSGTSSGTTSHSGKPTLDELNIRQRASLIGALFSTAATDTGMVYHISLPTAALMVD